MSNKENNFKEQFKQALISTAKVISEDYKLDLKKLDKDLNSKKIDFCDVTNLSNKHDFTRLRAETDLEALKKMGVQYKMIDGYVHANAKNGLIGAKIRFPKISVGATENLMISACLAKGQTILSNCAIEPEIKDLSNFLCSIGAKIVWIGKRQVKILGVKNFKQSIYKLIRFSLIRILFNSS